jgi:DNA topoisomerase-3
VAGIDTDDERRQRKPPPQQGDAGSSLPKLPRLTQGERLDGEFAPFAKKTLPPQRYSEATLLAAMESAGKTIDDEALRLAMRDCGLGTPATRAAIIETLLKRSYITRDKKQLQPTPTGEALIRALPVESLASPELTGEWEARLARIARGEESRAAFMRDIGRYVANVVDAIRGSPPPTTNGASEFKCPRCTQGRIIRGRRGWGCSRWREGCDFVVWFETNGKRVSEAELREIVARG